ncbi:MAG: uracil-DNA glycosylase family protein [Gaiellaceae bacterium]
MATAPEQRSRNEIESDLRRRSDIVYSANSDLVDHRRAHPWVTGALGDIYAKVWFIAEAPSLTQAERALDATPETQWSVSRGDKLFRRMLVKHGFKQGDETGGWRCYITDVVKSLSRAGQWSKLPMETKREIARAWAPVLRWELETGQPELVVTIGDRTNALLDCLRAEGLIPSLPRRVNIDHYSYVTMRPRGKLGPGHPIRIAEWDAAFAAIRASVDGAGENEAKALPPGDSKEQRLAEAVMLAALEREIGMPLEPRRLQIRDGVRVELDGASEDLSVLVEAFAHQGPLKSAQRMKVLTDAFKLAFIARELDQPNRLILLLSCEDAARKMQTGWAAEAIRSFGIEIIVVEIDPAVRQSLREAQKRQFR